jgi:HAD superfamily hydrolase (TIGR01458 family)
VIDVDGVLLDLEGTLVVAGEAIPGAARAVGELRERGVPCRGAPNATAVTRAELAETLAGHGIDVRPAEIITAPVVTAAYLEAHHPGARCFLLGMGGAGADLDGVELVGERADVVVVAGADAAFTWENLTAAYRMLLDGAALVAMHRNLAWRTGEGMTLDSGAFLLGLERASGVEATVIGKPTADFFAQAVELLGVPAGRAAMVGDDLDNDVIAAQRLGLTGVLVRTGKASSGTGADRVIDSIADLPRLIP